MFHYRLETKSYIINETKQIVDNILFDSKSIFYSHFHHLLFLILLQNVHHATTDLDFNRIARQISPCVHRCRYIRSYTRVVCNSQADYNSDLLDSLAPLRKPS